MFVASLWYGFFISVPFVPCMCRLCMNFERGLYKFWNLYPSLGSKRWPMDQSRRPRNFLGSIFLSYLTCSLPGMLEVLPWACSHGCCYKPYAPGPAYINTWISLIQGFGRMLYPASAPYCKILPTGYDRTCTADSIRDAPHGDSWNSSSCGIVFVPTKKCMISAGFTIFAALIHQYSISDC